MPKRSVGKTFDDIVEGFVVLVVGLPDFLVDIRLVFFEEHSQCKVYSAIIIISWDLEGIGGSCQTLDSGDENSQCFLDPVWELVEEFSHEEQVIGTSNPGSIDLYLFPEVVDRNS